MMEYNSYRVYIRDYYAERKDRSGFTWRDFARDAGYSSPVFLKLVCDGKSNLSEVGIERVASAMGLVGVDLQYFRLLVSFDQERDSASKKRVYAEMRQIAKENSMVLVGEDQYDYYENWVNPVLREVAPQMPGATPAKMAEKFVFDVNTAQVKKSLDLLQKTSLLSKDENGNFVQSSKSISTGNLETASLAIRDMHRQMGELAVRALDEVAVAERDISGMTMGISEAAFAKISKEIADFRRRIGAIVMEDAGEERVYRMNIQFFPLTKSLEKEGENAE